MDSSAARVEARSGDGRPESVASLLLLMSCTVLADARLFHTRCRTAVGACRVASPSPGKVPVRGCSAPGEDARNGDESRARSGAAAWLLLAGGDRDGDTRAARSASSSDTCAGVEASMLWLAPNMSVRPPSSARSLETEVLWYSGTPAHQIDTSQVTVEISRCSRLGLGGGVQGNLDGDYDWFVAV